ncbi:MAG: hypothetical protein C0424_02950 [Sphingobacteriaceae bacterium]|nr:hypothetical protein [Sphingobacteriaceae bacterium]
MRALALFCSGFFHPIFLPFYVMLLAFGLQPYDLLFFTPALQIYVLLQVLIIGTLLPMGAVLVFVRMGRMQSVMAENREERNLPYLIQALCLASLIFTFRNNGLPSLLIDLVVGALVAVLAAWFINRRWKISAHSVGMGGLVGFLAAIHSQTDLAMLWPLGAAVVLSGLVATARLYLNAHDPAQVYAGFLVGFASMVLVLLGYWINL